ncbi:MAG: tetratricopeptide repeat protein [Verrucomicrobia bacterium]|nr:tetratricopeptide repeat protein [Verrucomicrobiota bacterium]
MREALPQWLAQTNGCKPIVLVLDALNQIHGDEADLHLNWLPRFFPAHIRVVASCLPGPALDALRERGWAEHLLPLADIAERGRMIDSFLEIHRKQLGDKLRCQIINAPGTANPLFLRTVLEELRQFGSFEKLPDQVAEYLKATTPQDLFRQVIRRWQHDFHAGRDMVNRSLRHLWAARQGLSENEWLELLVDKCGPMDRQTWRPLLLAMEPHLVQRGSLWAFGHEFLRRSIDAELVPTDKQRQQAHHALADYFERQLTGPRKAEELPWQLREAGDSEHLPRHLLDIPFFLLILTRDQNELMGYWVWLEQERTMGQPYAQAFDLWAADKGESADVSLAANNLAFFLNAAALDAAAEPLYRRVLAIDEQSYGGKHPRVAAKLNGLAMLLKATNRLAEAEPLMRRALAISEASFGENHPYVAISLSILAALLQATNRLAEAEPLYRRALAIWEQSLGTEHPNVAIGLNNLATLLHATNRLAKAEPLMRRALAIAEAGFGSEHPEVATRLNNLAALLRASNRTREALPLIERGLRINEASFGVDHPSTAISLSWLADAYKATNRLAEAEPLMHRMVAILLNFTRATGYPHPHLQTFVGNFARLLRAMGRSREEIESTLAELGGRYGQDLTGLGEQGAPPGFRADIQGI